jgi:hypothetical protein
MKSTLPLRLCGLLIAALGLLASGCATIVKGTTQDIPISSDPAGARISIDGRPSGTTPTKVTMDRKHSHMVTIEQENYEVENVAITNSMGGAVAGNIILGGLVGWGVDAVSGAQYNLHPDTVSVRLRPKTQKTAADLRPAPTKTETFSKELAKLDEMKTDGKISGTEYDKMRTSLLTTFQAEPAKDPNNTK